MRVLYDSPSDLEERLRVLPDPKLSESVTKVLEKRYLRKDESGTVIESPKEMFYRVANVISQADSQYPDSNVEATEKKFYNLMVEGKFFPNSPTLNGAGKDINLSACYKLPIEDSREGIFIDGLYNAVCVQAFGGGTGFNFSKLRPKGAKIKSTGGSSSGPVSFMKIFDEAIGPVIAQGGVRNGANMGIMRYDHPDIEGFIDSKAEGGITNFNLSIGVTQEFMEMAEQGRSYDLVDHEGKVTGQRNAKDIFDKIVGNAWKNGDPGLIYLDRLDADNPTPKLGKIDGTNPCGEQPLLDFESCNLGSINLSKFVTEKGDVDYNGLRETVYGAVHFLDNVIDVNNYPLAKPQKDQNELESILRATGVEEEKVQASVKDWATSPIEKIVKGNRKIGLGVMGLADMFVQMGIEYGSEESHSVGKNIMKFIDETSKEASKDLAKNRGAFPNWDDSVYNTGNGNSESMKIRNATTTTIAPTGTLSMIAATSGGIEPLFGVAFERNTVYDAEGNPTMSFIDVNESFKKIAEEKGFADENLYKQIVANHGSLEGIESPEGIDSKDWRAIQKKFITAHDVDLEGHFRMQEVFQDHVDNAVSKTINMSNDASKEEIAKAYMLTKDRNVKGITIYRDGSKGNQVNSFGTKDSGLEEIAYIVPMKLPDQIDSRRTAMKTGCGKMFVNVGHLKYGEGKEQMVEIFANHGKAGGCASAQNEAIGRIVSLALRCNVDPEKIVHQLKGITCHEKSGLGPNAILSCPDAMGKALEKFLPEYSEKGKSPNTGIVEQSRENPGKIAIKHNGACEKCGGIMIGVGGCPTCQDCGHSKCA